MTRLRGSNRPGTETLELVPRPKPLYANAYSEPPYEMSEEDIEQFEIRITKHAGLDDFVLVAGELDGHLIGFSYGFTFLPGRWWAGVKTDPPPADIASGPPFAVIELGVHTDFRGCGFSRQFVDALLAGRPEPFRESHLPLRRTGSRDVSTLGIKKVGTTQTYPHWSVEDIDILPLRERQVRLTGAGLGSRRLSPRHLCGVSSCRRSLVVS